MVARQDILTFQSHDAGWASIYFFTTSRHVELASNHLSRSRDHGRGFAFFSEGLCLLRSLRTTCDGDKADSRCPPKEEVDYRANLRYHSLLHLRASWCGCAASNGKPMGSGGATGNLSQLICREVLCQIRSSIKDMHRSGTMAWRNRWTAYSEY